MPSLTAHAQKGRALVETTSFPGSLLFPSPGAREGDGKRRDPGNEVVVENDTEPTIRSFRSYKTIKTRLISEGSILATITL